MEWTKLGGGLLEGERGGSLVQGKGSGFKKSRHHQSEPPIPILRARNKGRKGGRSLVEGKKSGWKEWPITDKTEAR